MTRKYPAAKRLLPIVFAWLGVARFALAASTNVAVTISPSTNNAAPSAITLQPRDSATFTVTVVSSEQIGDKTYTLISGPTPKITPSGQNSVWTGGPAVFNVVNESPVELTTKASVTCQWSTATSGGAGGGGGGTGGAGADTIGGHASLTANLKIGHISWIIPTNTTIAGNSYQLAWEVKLLDSSNNLVNLSPTFNMTAANLNPTSTWTISPASGAGPDLNGTVKSDGGSRGKLKVTYDYFGQSKNDTSEQLTFVGMDKLQYKMTTNNWNNMPATLYVAKNATVNFKAIKKPADATWPTGKPVWGGASGSGEEASKTFDSFGTNFVTAECGTTVTGKIVVLNVEITPDTTNVFGGGTADFYLTTNIVAPGGVTWTIQPSNGVTFVPGANSVAVTPTGATGDVYTIRATANNNTNVYDEATLNVVRLKLREVTFSASGFSSYHAVYKDDGMVYPTPHWTTNGDVPALYVRNTKMRVQAVFDVSPATFSGPVAIKGDGPAGLTFTGRVVTAGGGTATYPATDSKTNLPNSVYFWNKLAIPWRYGATNAVNGLAGTSSNQIYVSLSDPNISILYHTVVHLACSVGNATNATGAVAQSWSQLAGHSFKTWDGRPLYYYQANIGWSLATSVAGLLSSSNGNCAAWRDLFKFALAANGVSCTDVSIRSAAGSTNQWFFVKDWNYGSPSYTNDPTYRWKFECAGSDIDMVPVPPSSVYGDLTSSSTIPGQNTQPPSEKVFWRHFIVAWGNTYYDPSYGVTYISTNDFQSKAVDGFGVDGPSGNILRVKKSAASPSEIIFY